MATLILGILGFLTAVFALRQSYLTRVRSSEMFYVKRYWKLMDDLPSPRPTVEPGGAQQTSVHDQQVAYAYLILCEDELDLRERGWITRQTYDVWADAMRVQLADEPFRTAWLTAVSAADSGTGQPFSQLKMFQAAPDKYLRRLPLIPTARLRLAEFLGL